LINDVTHEDLSLPVGNWKSLGKPLRGVLNNRFLSQRDRFLRLFTVKPFFWRANLGPGQSIIATGDFRFFGDSVRQNIFLSLFFTKMYFLQMETCKYKHCFSEDPSTPLCRCDDCAKHGIHVLCFTGLKQRSTYGELFVFCSVSCVDTGPLILSPDLRKFAGKLNKAQL
jgi:hypothetical protein